jgi:hypothetical protein
MSTEPKPATGEWTLQSISETLINGGYQGLLDAHNAALAAEGEKRADWNVVIEDLERALDAHRVENRLSQITMQQLRQQLAAERENRIREDREWERSKQLDLAEIQQLRSQLAAEQKHSAFCTKMANTRLDEIAQLRAKLAAAVELLGCSRYDAGDDESMNKEEALRNWIRAEDNPGFHRHE